jgi:hypothetical protein
MHGRWLGGGTRQTGPATSGLAWAGGLKCSARLGRLCPQATCPSGGATIPQRWPTGRRGEACGRSGPHGEQSGQNRKASVAGVHSGEERIDDGLVRAQVVGSDERTRAKR